MTNKPKLTYPIVAYPSLQRTNVTIPVTGAGFSPCFGGQRAVIASQNS